MARMTWAGLMRSVLRQDVLAEYARKVCSPSEIARKLDAPLNLVSYHTNVLREAGWLELVRTERRRGAAMHFYRAEVWGEIDDLAWEQLPSKVRRALVRGTLDAGWRDARNALPRGGMDEWTAHVSRLFLALDGQGRDELALLLGETRDTARFIEAASRERAAEDLSVQELVIIAFAAP